MLLKHSNNMTEAYRRYHVFADDCLVLHSDDNIYIEMECKGELHHGACDVDHVAFFLYSRTHDVTQELKDNAVRIIRDATHGCYDLSDFHMLEENGDVTANIFLVSLGRFDVLQLCCSLFQSALFRTPAACTTWQLPTDRKPAPSSASGSWWRARRRKEFSTSGRSPSSTVSSRTNTWSTS